MRPFVPEKMQYWSENHQIGWITGRWVAIRKNKKPFIIIRIVKPCPQTLSPETP